MDTQRMDHACVKEAQCRGAFRLTALCLGVMCILQASLNIVLRLHLASQVDTELCDNRTWSEDRERLLSHDDLLQKNIQWERSLVGLRHIRDRLQGERDELRRRLSNLAQTINKPGWIYFNSSIYYISVEKKSWYEGREDCRTRGADLVIINSTEEQVFLHKHFQAIEAWIGLTDVEEEGVWMWVDGSPLTAGYWYITEPNNHQGNENCVTTGYRFLNITTWNDVSCERSMSWICEITLPFLWK